MFVELAVRTNFSFLRGGSSPRTVVERAAQCGYDAIGIADCDGLYGMVRAMEVADELGVRLVVGCELAIDNAPLKRVWLHVATSEGYSNLCRLLTESHERYPKGKPRGACTQVAHDTASRRSARACTQVAHDTASRRSARACTQVAHDTASRRSARA